jgi:murein DD-endopeptidase MepM/ murein hydrolase activator NlpD
LVSGGVIRSTLRLAALGLLLPTPPGGAAEPSASVRPGTLVRWPGAGIESCAVGGRRFAALADACYYPVDLLHRAGALTVSRTRAGRRESAVVQVGKFDYPVQELTLPRGMVELSPADLARVRRENRQIARLWSREGPRRFSLPLQAPLDPLPEGGRFGDRRIINGSPRSPHGGSDFPAPQGAPVVAAADGVVALIGDHFFGGRSVFLDHGDGLITMYLHLSRVLVEQGEEVRRGQEVGKVGATGRATGPHLHFGVRWHGARVDPSLLLGPPDSIPSIG